MNTSASASHASVGNVGCDKTVNQRLILLSNKLAQKVNKSGDTMDGDLKLTFKPESSCVSLSIGVDGMDRNRSMHWDIYTTRFIMPMVLPFR